MQEKYPSTSSPPFSPVLFASLALQTLPEKLFLSVAGHILKKFEMSFPTVLERLVPLGVCVFHINPTDLHCSFLILLKRGKPTIEILSKNSKIPNVNATISGSLTLLIKLLEGRVDGDALFFTRELAVEGDTEAILTLRNAVDSTDISLEKILMDHAGPLKPIIKPSLSKLSSFYARTHTDFERIRLSLIEPLTRRIAQQDDQLDRQAIRLDRIEKEIIKVKTSLKRKMNLDKVN